MIYLYGASGHGKSILDTLLEDKKTFGGWFDDIPNRKIGKLISAPFPYGFVFEKDHLIISIGDNENRKKVVEKLELNKKPNYSKATHPRSILSKSVTIGEGTVVMAGAIINIDTIIGKHGIINTNASIDHDCQIGDFVHIAPGSTLCGGISIGSGTLVGAGATIIPNIKIGKGVIIGAGTVVISDIPDYSKVVGNPGRIINTGL